MAQRKPKNLKIETADDGLWREYILTQLNAHDAHYIKNPEINKSDSIHLYLVDAQGNVFGGLLGGILWEALFINTLWIHERFRRRGYGRKLIKKADSPSRSI